MPLPPAHYFISIIGSPRTAGPPPRDVLRLALPAPLQARLARRGPRPATCCGSHYQLHYRLASPPAAARTASLRLASPPAAARTAPPRLASPPAAART